MEPLAKDIEERVSMVRDNGTNELNQKGVAMYAFLNAANVFSAYLVSVSKVFRLRDRAMVSGEQTGFEQG